MKRTPIQRRTPLRSKPRHEPQVEKGDRPMARPLSKPANYSGGTSAKPVEKEAPQRNRALLDMAHGRRCLLLAVTHCHGFRGLTTVACHENEGKGMGLKVSDERTVWGCAACHEWYDRSGSPRTEKRRAFFAAHARQVQMWELVAADQSEPERFRKAAQWALERVNKK